MKESGPQRTYLWERQTISIMYATMETKQSLGNQEKGPLTLILIKSDKYQVDLQCQGLQTLFYGIKKLMKVSEDKAIKWSFNKYLSITGTQVGKEFQSFF